MEVRAGLEHASVGLGSSGMGSHTCPKANCIEVSLLPGQGRTAEDIALPVTDTATWNINRMHKAFNHAGDEALRNTAKAHRWKLTDTLNRCEDCHLSNARKKGVAKTTETKAEAPGERIFIDITSAKTPSMGGNKFLVSLMIRPILFG